MRADSLLLLEHLGDICDSYIPSLDLEWIALNELVLFQDVPGLVAAVGDRGWRPRGERVSQPLCVLGDEDDVEPVLRKVPLDRGVDLIDGEGGQPFAHGPDEVLHAVPAAVHGVSELAIL